jgi:hypothetical protein
MRKGAAALMFIADLGGIRMQELSEEFAARVSSSDPESRDLLRGFTLTLLLLVALSGSSRSRRFSSRIASATPSGNSPPASRVSPRASRSSTREGP